MKLQDAGTIKDGGPKHKSGPMVMTIKGNTSDGI